VAGVEEPGAAAEIEEAAGAVDMSRENVSVGRGGNEVWVS
jgi:hypothetical protein